jgi:hypothetical protein
VIASLIDGGLRDGREHYATLLEARPKPYVLDDATIARTKRVNGEGLQWCGVYDEQLRRWRRQRLTDAQRGEIDRLRVASGELRAPPRTASAARLELPATAPRAQRRLMDFSALSWLPRLRAAAQRGARRRGHPGLVSQLVIPGAIVPGDEKKDPAVLADLLWDLHLKRDRFRLQVDVEG